MCEASNWAGRRNATVFVEVLDTNVTAYCTADGVWPLTGAGKSASVECPKNRSTSYASRTCVLTADNVTEWQMSDYSRCTPDDLNKITINVRKWQFPKRIFSLLFFLVGLFFFNPLILLSWFILCDLPSQKKKKNLFRNLQKVSYFSCKILKIDYYPEKLNQNRILALISLRHLST